MLRLASNQTNKWFHRCLSSVFFVCYFSGGKKHQECCKIWGKYADDKYLNNTLANQKDHNDVKTSAVQTVTIVNF